MHATEPARFSDDHAARFTHRLETFFDIVLGLCLGMMSLNVALPHHAAYVYTQPFGLFAFAFTFLVVSLVWIAHNRLFEYFFVPTPLTVVLNFVTLALTVWLVYQLQVYVHFQNTSESGIAATSYIVTFSIVWLLIAAMFVESMRVRWAAILPLERQMGIRAIIRLVTIGLGSLATLALAHALRWTPEIVFAAIFLWALLARAAGPLVVRRIVG